MRTLTTDVLVIGSGFGAAPAALRFAQAGYDVIVLEKGPRIDPYRDFRQTQDPGYLTRYLKGLSGDSLSLTYAEALGGGSGFYEMVSLRAPSQAFRQMDDHGTPLWPTGLTRETLDPYYDRSEQMLEIRQIPPELVPKTGLVFARMMGNLGYSCERAPYAERGCVASGYCVSGCIYGAKRSLLLNYLPQATSAGAIIMCDAQARSIVPLARSLPMGTPRRAPYRYEVHVTQGVDGDREHFAIRTRTLILGGGTVGTAELLLASRRYLSGLSPHVGRNIAFNGGVKTAARLADDLPDGDMFLGRSHPGMISYHFLDSHGISIAAGKPLPIQAVISARLRFEGEERTPWFWGQPNVDIMQQMRRRLMVLVAFGFTRPTGRLNRTADGELTVSTPVSGELRRYHARTTSLLQGIMRDNGCTILEADFIDHEGQPYDDLHFSTAHQVGSCRMGDTPGRGVCDARGEVFGYPGMYITDGAAIPSSLAVNTSLTILANAERVVAGILDA